MLKILSSYRYRTLTACFIFVLLNQNCQSNRKGQKNLQILQKQSYRTQKIKVTRTSHALQLTVSGKVDPRLDGYQAKICNQETGDCEIENFTDPSPPILFVDEGRFSFQIQSCFRNTVCVDHVPEETIEIEIEKPPEKSKRSQID